MKTLGERLREIRKKMKMNQDAFAALGGVARNAQINYEKGNRTPDSNYLASLAKHGIDVAYVVSGLPDKVMNKMDAIKKATAVVEPLQLPDDIAADLHQILFFVEIKDREGIIKAMSGLSGSTRHISNHGQYVEGSITNKGGISFNQGGSNEKD